MVPPSSASNAQWARLVSLAVHELRTPAAVVSGYLRMVLKDHAGPVPDPQRRLLEEADRSCTRLASLLSEISDLAHLELGDAPFEYQSVDLAALLREVTESAPQGPDLAPVTLRDDGAPAALQGDASRLRTAISALIRCVQRELPAAGSIVVQRTTRPGWVSVAIGEAAAVGELLSAAHAATPPEAEFDEFRGGMGMTLAIARRVVERHGGRLIVLAGRPKAGVALAVPLS